MVIFNILWGCQFISFMGSGVFGTFSAEARNVSWFSPKLPDCVKLCPLIYCNLASHQNWSSESGTLVDAVVCEIWSHIHLALLNFIHLTQLLLFRLSPRVRVFLKCTWRESWDRIFTCMFGWRWILYRYPIFPVSWGP